MYLPFCVLLLTGLCYLTFLHLRRKPAGRWLVVTEGALAGVGLLLWPVVLLLLRRQLAGLETTKAAWAWDTMTTYLRYGGWTTGIFFALTTLCALTALWEKKYRAILHRRLRSLCTMLASVVLLALAGFFAAMSATDALPLDSYIHWLGVAGALCLRGMYLAEALWQNRTGAR